MEILRTWDVTEFAFFFIKWSLKQLHFLLEEVFVSDFFPFK